ncbi:MAG TPA: hypothetical protein VF712_00235 [Thermoleophilaceae bacterium]
MGRITSRLGRGEALLLALLAGWSLIPLAAGVVHLVEHGGVLGGSDGIGTVDHFQYLAWVREAGEHGLISNRYDLADESRVYLQPMWLASGLLWAAGLPVQAAFLLWKPACVAVLFGGCAAYVRRTVAGRGARVAALALALFYVPPAAVLLGRTGLGSATADGIAYLFGFQLGPATYLWGYVQTAVAVGLMPVFLLALERLVEPGRHGRAAAVAAGAGLLVAWVHPWQGMVLLGIGVAIAVWSRTVRPLALPLAATLAPLVYFVVLARIDTAWGEGSESVGASHQWGWLALALAPLALPALAGVARPAGTRERILLLWPLVTLLVFGLLDRTFYFNVLSGLTIPLAVLAVRGVRRLPRWAAVAAVAAVTAPGLVNFAYELREGTGAGNSPRYLEAGEADALEFVDDSPRSGGVLTRLYLGQAVPGLAGRRTYVGHPSWTPDLESRVDATERLFAGRMPAAEARALVRRTRVAFVVQDCAERHDLAATLGPLVRRTRDFGCARVYEVGA